MALSYLHYDVFTDRPLLGNQLAVFPDARGLETDLMQRIAREMNFAESTFIFPAERDDTGARMRIFTPGVELPMAGHPTIGSTFALAHARVIHPPTPRFVFGLNIGPTPVDLEWGAGELRFAWMTQLNPEFGPDVAERDAVAAALGLKPDDLAELPIQRVSCGLPYLIVPVRDHDAVDRAIGEAAAFRRLRAETDVELAVYLFALSPRGSTHTPYARMFAANFGIAEDPATGSAAGPLGSYLVRHGLIVGDDAQRIVVAQGVAMGRASRIHVAIEGSRDAISQVRVGGEAVLVGTGELLV